MTRDPALVPLSHDHHLVLAQALWLRRSVVEDAQERRERFLDFWHEEAEPHFVLEEEALIPACEHHGAHLAALANRMVVEHGELRAAVSGLEGAGPADPRVLHALGDHLQRHVRFEERVLFPLLESSLDTAELAAIAAQLAPRA